MKVLGVSSSIYRENRRNSYPNFEARLYTSNNLAKYFNKKVDDKALYIKNLKLLSQKLIALPDKPILVKLNAQASRLFNEGKILSAEPAAEVCIGIPSVKDDFLVESKVVPVDITSEPENFYEKVYNIACSLIYEK